MAAPRNIDRENGRNGGLDAAGIHLLELIGSPLEGSAWEVVRSRRMIMRAGGVDVSDADGLLDTPAFGRRRGDAARYEQALDACVDLDKPA